MEFLKTLVIGVAGLTAFIMVAFLISVLIVNWPETSSVVILSALFFGAAMGLGSLLRGK